MADSPVSSKSWTSDPAIYVSGAGIVAAAYLGKKLHDQQQTIDEMQTTIKSLIDQMSEFSALISKQDEGRRHILREKANLENEVTKLKDTLDSVRKNQDRINYENHQLRSAVSTIYYRNNTMNKQAVQQSSPANDHSQQQTPQRMQAISRDDMSEELRESMGHPMQRESMGHPMQRESMGHPMQRESMGHPMQRESMGHPMSHQEQMSQRFYPQEQLMFPPDGYSAHYQPPPVPSSYMPPPLQPIASYTQQSQQSHQNQPTRYPSIGDHLDALGTGD
jgi:uncharacterized protein YoxC